MNARQAFSCTIVFGRYAVVRVLFVFLECRNAERLTGYAEGTVQLLAVLKKQMEKSRHDMNLNYYTGGTRKGGKCDFTVKSDKARFWQQTNDGV